ncbi:cell wall-binding repeat-containing protein [Herbiconiux sp. VKM Ac-1786]|uniref:cell wall-binding repeat-containing protein n=1 Tax=Herbiconiux sp. VKM Ac-1786 TaxID=2783824 RepID=UPI00188BBCD4|nr:cell wall-binding repeat-containing protein [Herbiconiux sp. VKM Ac-1786]MBF4573125.1 cell wall-binding repeat-containing protein [Herbiconiux sp. VKM Ac-1786]
MTISTTNRPSGRRARRAASTLGILAVAAGAVLVPTAAHAEDVPPTATADTYTVGSGVLFRVGAGQGLLANDLNLGAGQFVAPATDPGHGTLDVELDGSFTYLPAAGFIGADSFTYCIKIADTLPCLSAEVKVSLKVDPTMDRIGGADRFVVSAAISQKTFEPEVGTAYIASGETFPDALSASAAAGADGGPVLLLRKDAISSEVDTELRRLMPQRIVVVGGEQAITKAVETALGTYSDVVERIGGADRFVVSAEISEKTFGIDRPVAYVASGEDFPDALAGSAAAGVKGGPVLLVRKDGVPTAVADELRRLNPAKIVLLGGPNAVSETTKTALQAIKPVTRIGGTDRFVVASAVSADAFSTTDTHTVYIASGEKFPDALSGSAAAIDGHAPVLLVTRDGLPAATATELDRLNPTRIVVLGGEQAVSAATFTALQSHLG